MRSQISQLQLQLIFKILDSYFQIYIYIYIYIYMCVCVCVCVGKATRSWSWIFISSQYWLPEYVELCPFVPQHTCMEWCVSKTNFIIVIFVDNFVGNFLKKMFFLGNSRRWHYSSQRETDVPLLDQSGDVLVKGKSIGRLHGWGWLSIGRMSLLFNSQTF